MSLQPKTLSVAWAPQVSGAWTLRRLKDIARIVNGYPFDSKGFDVAGEHPLVRIRDLASSTTETRYNGPWIEAAAIHPGDVLIGMDGDFNVGIWKGSKALLNQRMCCVRAESPILTRFLAYVLPTPLGVANQLTYYTTVKHLSSLDVERITVAVPPTHLLPTVVRFLDEQTARIDALIAEKERLSDLIDESRRVEVSRAVTRGLDPAVALRASGSEWIDSVPAHWQVKRLKYLIRPSGLVRGPFGGDLKKEIFVESGVKVYEQKNAIYGNHELGSAFITREKFEAMRRFSVRPGDYLMSCSGTIGKVYRVSEDAPEGIINQALLILRFNELLSSEFADWVFVSDFFYSQIVDNSQGGAMKNLVGMNVFTSISIPVPPLAEQRAIAQYLRSKMGDMDMLKTHVTIHIERLREYRSSLISAAVTGQLDINSYKEAA